MIKKDKILAFVQTIICWVALGVFKIFFRFKAEGQENLKGLENSPVIFTSNHNSYLDGIFAVVSLPKISLWSKNFFPIRFLMTDRFFRWNHFPINLICKLIGAVKVTRAKNKKPDNSHLRQVLAEPIKLLKEGKKIWIYPEGGFHKDGTPKKPRVGAAFLHQQTKAPILPIRIIGNAKVMSKIVPFLPRITTLIGLNKIKVIIGKPIYYLENLSLEEDTSKIMQSIYKLK